MKMRRATYLVAFVALIGLSAPLISSSQQATLEISKVSPDTVLPGNSLRITGNGFAGTPTLVFSGNTVVERTYVTLSPTFLFVSTPNLPSGEYTVHVVHKSTGTKSNTVAITIGDVPSPTPTPTITPTPSQGTTPNCILQPGGCAERQQFAVLGDSVSVGAGSFTNFANETVVALERRGERRPEVQQKARVGAKSGELRQQTESTAVRDVLQKAEIVTVQIGGNDLRVARRAYQSGTCGGGDNQACLRTTVQEVKKDWNAIVQIIARETTDTATLIALDIYNPYVAEDQATDSWSGDAIENDFVVFRSHLAEINRHMRRVADAAGMQFVSLAEIMNGSDGTQDSAARGLLSWDELHPNERAHRLIAERIVSLL